MRTGNSIPQKHFNLDQLQQQLYRWRLLSKSIAFTNGCFDILHAGHIASLIQAASYADVLIVGLNSDTSVKALKGPGRPVNSETDRVAVLSALSMVDAVVIFNEETPLELIKTIRPDVLIKGGDYKIEDIAGAKEVLEWGGQVFQNPIVPGLSTTGVIHKLQQSK